MFSFTEPVMQFQQKEHELNRQQLPVHLVNSKVMLIMSLKICT